MKVALRDDDTSYFTDPERLDRVYHDVWDRLPVCLAVVPQAMGFADKAIPERYWQSHRAYPLEENPAIVARLKELTAAGRVTIAQVQQCSRVRDRQIEGCAFANLVKIHIPTPSARISCRRGRACGAHGSRDASQHRL